jgi:8-oxo-dGTP pyrophosphatase MutT (NUDIX family)
LPYQRSADGLRILLITSRETGRWVVPKGWPMKNRSPSEAAAIEALQEAGVLGWISGLSIGRFHYVKRLAGDVVTPCDVEVFPMRVTREKSRWREKHQRTRRWFPRDEAAASVQEPELRRLIETFEPA